MIILLPMQFGLYQQINSPEDPKRQEKAHPERTGHVKINFALYWRKLGRINKIDVSGAIVLAEDCLLHKVSTNILCYFD